MINSSSGIKTFQLCSQKWAYTYLHKREPLDDSSFESAYGRGFHSLCEQKPVDGFGPKWTSILNEHYNAYQKRWSNDNYWCDVNYLAHEVAFEFDLSDGYTYRGIVDAIVEIGGETYLLETKTTGWDIDRFCENIEHALQPNLYLLAAKRSLVLTPYNISGIIIDVTKRPTIRQKRGESDKVFIARVASWYHDNRSTVFGRSLITRTDDYLHDLAGELMMVTDLQERGMITKNRDSCYAYRKQCGFFPVCFQQEDINNEQLYQIRRKR